MILPIAPPRAIASARPIHFQYVGVEKGEPWEAYLAGPVWWGKLHMLRPSKPCVYELTGELLACRFCGRAPKPIAVMKGWVPLYRRQDGLAVCVPVDEVIRDDLDRVPHLAKVMVGRGKGKGVSAFVRIATNQDPKYQTTLPERRHPADVSPSLITMWALPEVTQFFCGKSSDKPLSQTQGVNDGTVSVAADGSEASGGAGVHLLGDSFLGALSEDTQREIARRRNEVFVNEAKKPKKNGKH